MGETAGVAVALIPAGGVAKVLSSLLKLSKLDKLFKFFSKTDQPNSPSPGVKPQVEKQPEGAPKIPVHPHDPYQEAMNGGKHSGWAKPYLDKPTSQIEKGIRSLEKQINLHEDKIANPQKHIPNCAGYRKDHQQDLIQNKWPGDIARQKEQKNILEGILRDRNAER